MDTSHRPHMLRVMTERVGEEEEDLLATAAAGVDLVLLDMLTGALLLLAVW